MLRTDAPAGASVAFARCAGGGDNRLVIITIGVLLAIFVVPDPWTVPVIGLAVVVEIAETLFWMRHSRRGSLKAGPETMIGEIGRVVTSCDPIGEVRLHGEMWRARCDHGTAAGQRVRIVARDGLTLLVEPDQSQPGGSSVVGR